MTESKPSPESQLNFLLEVLRETHHSKRNRLVVYPLLEANLDKLNNNFAQLLQNWADSTLTQIHPEQAQGLASDIVDFSILIRQFPLGNQATNQEIAIKGYKIAATVFTCEEFPREWATIQNNLAIGYRNRIYEEKAQNIEIALKYYLAALRVCKREAFPEDWANTQQNLGVTYKSRILGERSENLEEAICCFNAALDVYTRETSGYDWAMIHNNLGIAYTYRIRENRTKNLEEAIHCFEVALEVRTYEDFPSEWAMTQNNLGIAYWESIYQERENNLESTIQCFKYALEVYTRIFFPYQWSMLQNNLGNAYVNRIKGNKDDNLEEAICYFNAALEVRTREAFPKDWATTHNNLGEMYRRCLKGDKADNLNNAIRHLKMALEVRTREKFPQFHIETLFNLGFAYQEAEDFHQANTIFANAIETLELLRAEILSNSGLEIDKQDAHRKLAEKWNKLYELMVDNCLKLGYYNDAIEYAERSKTRNLVELILNRDLKTIFPSEIVSQIEQLRDEIASSQYQLQAGKTDNPTALALNIQQLRQRRNELQNNYFPVGYGFNFGQFQDSLDDKTVIIQWYITLVGLETFIITRDSFQRLILPTSDRNLQDLDDWANEYLDAYTQNKNEWINSLASHLSHLSKILNIDEIINCEDIKKCSRLILIPHRYLHLFPLHALPLANGDFLCDRFPNGVGYSPSCQLLQLAQERGKNRHQFSRLFAIQNPIRSELKPLLGAKLEVNRIRQHFNQENIIIISEAEASEATLNQRMSELSSAHCIHFSCHGKFEPQYPSESALKLADPDGKLGKEADLTLGKIFEQLKLDQCRLVTFSSCESGMTDSTSISDEYIGLPSGFLYAGSPSVVSTLWTVDPLATTLLLTKFYHNLKKQSQLEAGSIANALNQAQIWLRALSSKKLERIQKSQKFQLLLEQAFENKKRDRMKFNDLLNATVKRQPYPFANPYYWSCFVATGL